MFTEEKENFNEIDPDPDPGYNIKVSYSRNNAQFYELKTDTVWLEEDESISFNISSPSIYGFDVLIDDQVVYNDYSDGAPSNRFFDLSGEGITPGEHKLEIIGHVKSGTNSLADNLSAEYASYIASYVLMIGPMDYFPKILNMSLKDGALWMEWNPYTRRSDFQKYDILVSDSYPLMGSDLSQSVFDAGTTSTIDSTFLGRPTNYQVRLDRGGEYVTSYNYHFNYNYKPQIEFRATQDGRFSLSWSPPEFEKSILSYDLKYYTPDEVVVLAGDIPADQHSVTFDFNAMIGQRFNFRLGLQSHRTASGHQKSTSFSEKIALGTRIPPINDIIYDEQSEQYYMIFNKQYADDYAGGVYRMNKELDLLERLPTDSGSYAYTNLLMSRDKSQLFLLHDYSIVKLNRNPLGIAERQYVGRFYTYDGGEIFEVSNNGFILYFLFSSFNGLRVMDFATREILLSLDEVHGPADLSPNGMYLAAELALYQFDGARFIKTFDFPYPDIRFYQFLEDALIIATEEHVILYDYISHQEIKAHLFRTTESRQPYYNHATGRYLFFEDQQIKMLDIQSGEVSFVPVYNADVRYVGNHLFSSYGFGVKYE